MKLREQERGNIFGLEADEGLRSIVEAIDARRYVVHNVLSDPRARVTVYDILMKCDGEGNRMMSHVRWSTTAMGLKVAKLSSI